jgi:excisionase family DNA binding protein
VPEATAARLLTADDLAARWQVARGHIYHLAREGKLPVVELGRYKRFRLTAIEDFEAAGGCAADD